MRIDISNVCVSLVNYELFKVIVLYSLRNYMSMHLTNFIPF